MVSKNEKGSRTNIPATIPAMLRGALAAMLAGSRRTGRTVTALKLIMAELSKNPTGRVTYICHIREAALYAENLWLVLCREHDIDQATARQRVDFVTVEPHGYKLVEAFQSRIKMPSAIFFDHAWLEEYHDKRLLEAHEELVGTVQAFTGRYAAMERARDPVIPQLDPGPRK